MKIAIFGTGYVGLVTGVCLAKNGKKVYCIDKDTEIVNSIKKCISPFYEPGLDNLLKNNIENIYPTTDAEIAIKDSDVIIIAVGTPFDGNCIDLSYIKQASKEIGAVLKDTDQYKVVVVKSTVIPGTTLNVVKSIVLEKSAKTSDKIGFCMNPEFLREGNAVEDFGVPDRIVLGVTSKRVENVMREVYSGFPDTDFVITNPTTAEMIKYTANSFLALTISYANEIARICETLEEVDSEDVFHGVILDKRISPIVNGKRIFPQLITYLRAGCGFGGSCFPKDVKALATFEAAQSIEGGLLKSLLEINDAQIRHVYELGMRSHRGSAKNIAILGTAFKPDTDDIREAPGIKLAEMGLEDGMSIYVHDYKALENTEKLFGKKVQYCKEPLEATNNADIVFITTIWDKYLDISDEDFETNLKRDAILVDCRSLYKKRDNKPWRITIGSGRDSLTSSNNCKEQ